MATPERKILRIGIIHNNRIIEERLFRKPERITIGQSPENTFVYPLPSFPRSYELFAFKDGAYTFVFPKGLEGKVSSGEDIFDLDELVQGGKAKAAGEFFRLGLNEETRGKILLGDLTLLFQFVTPPPPVPKLQLPAAAQVSWIRSIDMQYAVFLLISFLVIAGPMTYMQVWYETKGKYLVSMGKKSKLFQDLEAEVEFRQKKEKKEEVVEVAKNEGPAEEVKEEKPVEEAPKAKPAEKPSASGKGSKGGEVEDKEKRYKKNVENVKKNTLIKFLVGGEGGGEGGPVASGVAADKIGDAWDFKGGAQVAQEGDVGEFIGQPKGSGTGGSVYQKGSEKYSGKKAIATGEVEAPAAREGVKLNLKIGGDLGDAFGAGAVDKGSVSAVFKRRAGAIRHCYEKRLKVNQELSGKIRVMFTIGPAGRVTTIVIKDNSSGDAELAACISDRIKEWPFPRPSGGSVTFVHTIVLTKG
jgi:outer membrane biosynthesis protein TonB